MGLEAMSRPTRFGRSRDQIRHSFSLRPNDITYQLRQLGVTTGFGKEVDDKCGDDPGRILAAMRGEKDLEGFEQGRGLSGPLQDLCNLFLVFFSDRGDDFILVSKIAIDEADADAGLSADVVHRSLVKTRLGKANYGGVEDLSATIIRGFGTFVLHERVGTMNERSFIVKSDAKIFSPARPLAPAGLVPARGES